MSSRAINDNHPPPWEPAGEIATIEALIECAVYELRPWRPLFFDARNRPCREGADFMRAYKEGAFPIRYYWRRPHGKSRALSA